jgi:arylformamidase
MGSHNGTHMDAPKHFVAGAKDVTEMDLEKCVGPCKVVLHQGLLTAETAEAFLADGTKRLLIRGDIEITPEAAAAFAKGGLWFLGVEGMTVGGPATGKTVHQNILGAEIALLESAVMTEVEAGEYFLSCAPLKMKGLDGSPCRPLLIKM